jgi:hypothetical protein
MIVKQVENDFIRFWIEDGILHSQFKKTTIVNIERIKSLIDLRTEISTGEKQYWCYDFNGIKSYDVDARNYADKNGQEYLYACAVVFNSHIARFILNTFIGLKKPVVPLKGFMQKKDAMNWLNEIKEKNEQL